jgi:probable phosphoglycerate mutase
MKRQLPRIYLARHGETEWSLSGRHTGLTDIPLTRQGEQNACRLGERLQGLSFNRVVTSPLRRAWHTCELAGYGKAATRDHDLVEWDYGDYEGKTTPQIHRQRPAWEVFRDGCPGGESVDQVTVRADRVITRLRAEQGNVLLFSHGHFLRVLAARWLKLEPAAGRCFYLGTAALSIIGYEHGLDDTVILLWNDNRHVSESVRRSD